MDPKALDSDEFLAELRQRGATRLRRVAFRRNRCTLWSLTQNGGVLNLHVAYESASSDLLDAFAEVVRGGGVASGSTRAAASVIGAWPALATALEEARSERGVGRESACCATSGQVRYLRALYRYFNRTRFGGLLPDQVPVRLSSRMRSSLGYMLPGTAGAHGRSVVEIALNVDLMLAGNGAERVDTLLHEMAHAADYLLTGHRGHGRSWREWARRAGCRPARLYDRPVRARRRREAAATRVPPLPPALQSLVG